MNIDFKDGVSFKGLKAITYEAIFVCAQAFNKRYLPLVVTSTTDGKHTENSFHYTGEAFDIGTRRLTVVEKTYLFNEIRDELHKISKYFQVVMEETHIHVEFDWRQS